MARFEVTVSEMQNAASKIQQAAEDFLTAAGQVMSSAEALGESWEGDSQVAFMEEQTQANAWYNKMVSLVSEYVAMLNNAAKTYAQADADATGAVRSR